MPGHELFQYIDGEGRRQAIGSADVNHYLRDITAEPFTSKDFRTWGGTVLAACELARTCAGRPSTTRSMNEAVKAVSKRLGNTPAVCRKGYIHPDVFAAAAKGTFVARPTESGVVALLRKHIRKA